MLHSRGVERLLYSVESNRQKLDGGAMFGNAPKALWEKWAPADEKNRIDLACRCLLVKEASRWILFEAGIGAFFEPKLKERFGVMESRHVLLDELARIGISDADVAIVVLSHLHFDHAGGVLSEWREGAPVELRFPNARFVVGDEAWARAKSPHARDRASFVKELTALLEASGRLEVVKGDRSESLGSEYSFHRSNGHTPGLLLSEIPGSSGPILFASDLIPGRAWVRKALTMGYDRYPELLIDEKSALLERLIERRGRLFFTHDPECALASLAREPSGEIGWTAPLARLDGVPA
jgi:glyoxylase-like metal-dependent hydrolase (beta-lactamase superfamily II)